MSKVQRKLVLFLGLIISTGGVLALAASRASLATSEIAQTPTPTPSPTSTSSPRPTPTATPSPTSTSSPRPTPTATPSPTSTSSPRPTPTATPSPTSTSSPQSTVPLSEKASYIGKCRSSGSTALKVYADTAQTQLVSEMKPFTKVILTGVLGEGMAQISKPALGWVKTATLLTNCDAAPKTP